MPLDRSGADTDQLNQLALSSDGASALPRSIVPGSSVPLDTKRILEAVSKNHKAWLLAQRRQFELEEGFLPFPVEDADCACQNRHEPNPGFEYTIIEALEKATRDIGADPMRALANDLGAPEHLTHEWGILRDMINSPQFKQDISKGHLPPGHPPPGDLADLFLPLHEGVRCEYSQVRRETPYDLDLPSIPPLGNYHYECGSHHIQVEVESVPRGQEFPKRGPGPVAGDEDGPSCEFTFEYDQKGQLIPMYNNVEEKLREMKLNAGNGPSHPELASEASGQDIATRKKKKKPKKPRKIPIPDEGCAPPDGSEAAPSSDTGDAVREKSPSAPEKKPLATDCQETCLLCEYTILFGRAPRQLLKWFHQRARGEMERREEIKRKLENTKLRAIRKQRELRQKQLHQKRVLEQIEESQKMLLVDNDRYSPPQSQGSSEATDSHDKQHEVNTHSNGDP